MQATAKKKALLLQQLLPWTHNAHRLGRSLKGCSDSELFFVGIEHRAIWNAVESMMKKVCLPQPVPDVGIFREPRTPTGILFARLPVEMYSEIVSHLNIRDLMSLSMTCKFFRRECFKQLERFLERAFSKVGLNWISVRFMLKQTDSLISGLFAHHLLFLQSHAPLLAKCKNVDIYVKGSANGNAIVKYLSLATDYCEVRVALEPTDHIKQTVYLRTAHPLPSNVQIAVHWCREDPKTAVFRQSLTSVFGWMSAEGFFVAYPRLTFANRGLVSHRYFPLDDAVDIQRLALLSKVAKSHRIQLCLYHQDEERCGLSVFCPSISRSTIDGANFRMTFAARGWDRSVGTPGANRQVAWCLGSKDCEVRRRGVFYSVNAFNANRNKRIDGVYMARMENVI